MKNKKKMNIMALATTQISATRNENAKLEISTDIKTFRREFAPG